MTIVAVQRIGKGTAGASVSIGSGDGWATPTAGNLLVFSANSDALVTLSGVGTVTAGPSVIDGNGAYTWYKVATGSETTITATPSVSDDIVLTACEYSGVAAFDASNSSTISNINGSATTAAPVTTTQSGDLIVAVALLHSLDATSPTGPSWSGSLANVLSPNSGTSNPATQRCVTFVGELLSCPTAGSFSTAASWTNGANDRQQIVLAFTASAAATAVFPLNQPVRHRPAVRPSRGARVSAPVRTQVDVPVPVNPSRPLRAARALPLLRRRRGAAPVPPQAAVPPATPPVTLRARLRGLRLFRGRAGAPVPVQVAATPPTRVPQPARPRARLFAPRRGRSVMPWPQATTPASADAPGPILRTTARARALITTVRERLLRTSTRGD